MGFYRLDVEGWGGGEGIGHLDYYIVYISQNGQGNDFVAKSKSFAICGTLK